MPEHSKLEKALTVFVVLLPLLAQYRSVIPGVSLGEIALLPFAVAYFAASVAKGGDRRGFFGLYVIFAMVLLANTLAVICQPFCSFSDSVSVLIRIAFYAVLIFAVRGRIDAVLLCRLLVLLAFANGFYTIIQFVSYQVSGVYLPITLPFLEVESSEGGIRLDLDSYYMWSFRPSGFFLEPSYAALFSAPGLALSLLSNKAILEKRADLFAAFVITVGLFLSTSSMGLAILAIVWIAAIFKRIVYRGEDGTTRISSPGLLAAMGIAVFLIAVLFSGLVDSSLSRVSSGGSFGQRILRGVELAQDMDIRTFIMGTGLNNLTEYVRYYGATTPYDEANLEYVSAFAGALLNSGILVFIGYMAFSAKLFLSQKDILGKTIALVFIVLCFVEAMTNSYRFAFYVVILFALYDFGDCAVSHVLCGDEERIHVFKKRGYGEASA